LQDSSTFEISTLLLGLVEDDW